MIDLYTIKMTPAMSHKHIMKNFDSGAGPEQTNQLTKVKAKVEIIGDYADMEKLRISSTSFKGSS